MDAKVTKAFGDRLNGDKLYLPGDAFQGEEPRIAELEALGLVERIGEDATAEPEPEPAPKPKPAPRKRAAKTKE